MAPRPPISMTLLANFHCLATQYINYTSGDIEIHINFTIICFYKMSAKWLSAPWDVGSLDESPTGCRLRGIALSPAHTMRLSSFVGTQRRRKDENRMVYAHQRRSSFVDFTNATVVGPIRKSNRSNNCRMV